MRLHLARGTAATRTDRVPPHDRGSTLPESSGASGSTAQTYNKEYISPAGAPCRAGGVVEIIGPAGAGKSTLATALGACQAGSARDLSLWNLPRRFLLASAVSLTPHVATAAVSSRDLHASEIAQMLRMGALRHAVERARQSGTQLIVLDEGPVFGLTWLDVFFSNCHDSKWASWRRAVLHTWAHRLSAVVWIDAADATLMHRIRTRAKPHPVKESHDHEIRAFTARFRTAFDRVVHDLTTIKRLRVVKVRTDDVTPETMAVRLRAALRGGVHGA